MGERHSLSTRVGGVFAGVLSYQLPVAQYSHQGQLTPISGTSIKQTSLTGWICPQVPVAVMSHGTLLHQQRSKRIVWEMLTPWFQSRKTRSYRTTHISIYSRDMGIAPTPWITSQANAILSISCTSPESGAAPEEQYCKFPPRRLRIYRHQLWGLSLGTRLTLRKTSASYTACLTSPLVRQFSSLVLTALVSSAPLRPPAAICVLTAAWILLD